MGGSKVAAVSVVVVFLMWYGTLTCWGREVSVGCMMAYDQGGAPAVFTSPECLLWNFSIESAPGRRNNCHFSILQGWREYQEDRVACDLSIDVPILDQNGLKHVNFSVAAVFDGHGGDEASEFASKYFLNYFLLHVVFNNYKRAFPFHKEKEVTDRQINAAESRPFNQILEEAMLKTFKDIDSEFSQKALENGYISGSTGTVVLLVDGHVLVGQVGDSKAILCSHRTNTHPDAEGACETDLYASKLTRDHHPDAEDEKVRIEGSGGFVSQWDVPRVNGILAMSRAIGDVQLKRYGVIAEAEISWRTLTDADSYLIVGSDGVFERMTETDVCNLLREDSCCITTNTTSNHQILGSCSSPSLLAKRIVDAAFESGSTDNLSAILILLEPYLSSH